MRVTRSALLLIAAAALAAATAGSAFAQRMLDRGPSNISRGNSFNPDGPRGGFRGPRFGLPGIVTVLPGGGDVYVTDDGPSGPPRQRTTQRRTSNAPPPGERRMVPDEVVIEIANSASTLQIDALRSRHRLVRMESQSFQLSGTTLFRWRIPDRRSVTAVVRELERDRLVASVQPNYLFVAQDDTAKPPGEGDPAQYALAKLHLPQAHALAQGNDVRVAVIDSGIDLQNAELAGSIAESFDALPGPMVPHKHGTAIASLIAAHGKLMGVAPGAKILAVRAFDGDSNGAKGTTFNILKALDWAAANSARIINMSFAGPSDPAMRRSLEAAHKKGIVLIAAAGNAGPKSPPLFPAADANVIAVSATDADDKLLPVSNRGPHIAISAPGAQILVAIPDGYEMSSGTSYSAAEVSGIAALMLQHDPSLTPDRLRAILQSTARDLGPKGRDIQFGYGLADAYAAVNAEPVPVARVPLPAERASNSAR